MENVEYVSDAEEDEQFEQWLQQVLDLRKSPRITRSGEGTRRVSEAMRRQLAEAYDHFAHGDTTQCLQSIREMVCINAEFPEIYSLLTQVFEDRGETAKALLARRLEADLLKTNVSKWVACAQKSTELGRTEDAIYAYNRAIRVERLNTALYWEKAQCLKAAGEPLKAIQTLERALENSSSNGPADVQRREESEQLRWTVAMWSYEIGESQKSARMLRALIDDAEELNFTYLNGLGELYLKEEAWRDWVDYLREVSRRTRYSNFEPLSSPREVQFIDILYK